MRAFPCWPRIENEKGNFPRSCSPGKSDDQHGQNGAGRGRLLLDSAEELKEYEEIRDLLSIRAYSPRHLITKLSGGNQQKVMIGRALVSKSRILLLNEPTRGVDVGTKMEIHALIRRLAGQGYAILVSSSDVPELVAVSDRCVVFSAGRTKGTLTKEQITEDNITALAIGRGIMAETEMEERDGDR